MIKGATMRQSPYHKGRRGVVPVFVITVSLLGCATVQKVQPEPFSEFSSSVQELRRGADAALEINEKLNRERFVDETLADLGGPEGAESVTNLLIGGKANLPFAWTMGQTPLFMASRRFRHGVYTLNTTLVAYSELLKELASPKLVSREHFDGMARDLDANLTSAALALDIKGADQGLAIFSVAASTAMHAYIQNRRRAALRDALEKNQVHIKGISTQLQQAMRLAARNLRNDYENRWRPLATQLTPGAGGTQSARRRKIEAIITLNEEFVTRLSALETLNSSYRVLPGAHRELITALDNSGSGLSSIRELYANGKRLHNLYKELAASAETKN